MAEGAGLNYVAARVIERDGARAYNPGDLVHVSAVEGPAAWLRAGVDVLPRPGVRLDPPAGNAPTQAWADYAVSCGADPAEADGLSRDQLRDRYAGEAPVTAGPPIPAGDDAPVATQAAPPDAAGIPDEETV